MAALATARATARGGSLSLCALLCSVSAVFSAAELCADAAFPATPVLCSAAGDVLTAACDSVRDADAAMKQFMPAMFLVWMFLVWKLCVGAYGANLRDARARLHAACTTLHERLVGGAVAGLQWYWRLLMIARGLAVLWARLFAERRLHKAACSRIRRLLAEAHGGLQRGRAVAVAEFSRIRARVSAQLDTPQAAITRRGLAHLRGGGSPDNARPTLQEMRRRQDELRRRQLELRRRLSEQLSSSPPGVPEALVGVGHALEAPVSAPITSSSSEEEDEKRALEPTGSTDSPTPNEAHEASSRPH